MKRNICDYHSSSYSPYNHWESWDDDDYEYGYRKPEVDLQQALDPLIRQMQVYDRHRQQLEKQGGQIADLAVISKTLLKEIPLEGHFRSQTVALADPRSVRRALMDIDYGLHLQVRELGSGMPSYYLCRIKDTYFSNYSLVVEDLYCSPGYPIPDKRFVRFMMGGKEKFFLRLSPYRESVKKELHKKQKPKDAIERKTDKLLYNLGRYVLSQAWHEDQFPGIQTAESFRLTCFPQAIELLYLDLSGDLCELRSEIGDDMIDFFQTTHPQPAIYDFLTKLQELNGVELNELPKQGLSSYVSLQKAFPSFLSTEIPWGNRKPKMPLGTLLLANFSRLDLVGKALEKFDEAVPAKEQLEKEALRIIRAITNKQLDSQVK